MLNNEFIKSVLEVKMACAEANMSLGVLDRKIGEAIVKACKYIQNGKIELDIDHYHINKEKYWNSEINKFISRHVLESAGRKGGRYCDEKHVNFNQSADGIMSLALSLATYKMIEGLENISNEIILAINKKIIDLDKIINKNNPSLHDSFPLALRSELSGWIKNLHSRLCELSSTKKDLRLLNFDSTFDNDLRMNIRFNNLLIKNLKKNTRIPFSDRHNKVGSERFLDNFHQISNLLKLIAVDILNIYQLLENIKSIDVNNIDIAKLICYDIIGNDSAINKCLSSQKQNIIVPFLSNKLITNISLLIDSLDICTEQISSIDTNKKSLIESFDNNIKIKSVLLNVLGEQKSIEIINESLIKNKSIKDIIIQKRLLSQKEAEEIFNIKNFKL
jgi:aspartate ammonia-lyase